MATAYYAQANSRIPRILQLQPTIHRALLYEVTTTCEIDKERSTLLIEKGTRRCILNTQNRMHHCTNFDQLST